MRKKIIIIITVVLLIIAGYAYHLFTEGRLGISGIKADININAVDLYSQFQTDETAANKKYLDKVIEVKGSVTDIQQTDSTLAIELKGADLGGINCGMADVTAKTLPVQKGEMVTVKGRCSGFLMDVNMVDCEIEK